MVETTLPGLFIAWAVFWVGFLGLLMFWEWRHDSRRFPVYDRGGRSVRLFLDGREVRLPTDITLKELGYAYHQATRGKREANP